MIIDKLSGLAGKKHLKTVSRGNKAIQYALKAAASLGKKKIFLQDQGGWITYRQYSEKMRFEIIELKTDHGILEVQDIESLIDDNSILLLNSMPGYIVCQEMEEIAKVCKDKRCFLINDATGSIGEASAKYGDIIVCSFGKDKPIPLGSGGMIAADDENYLIDVEEVEVSPEIISLIDTIPKRRLAVETIRESVVKELKALVESELDIVHSDKPGFNAVVIFRNPEQKEKIISYCTMRGLEYTLCPRYIRVLDDAVSIEIKRLFIDDKYVMFQ